MCSWKSTHNFGDPKVWEARRIELEPEVRAEMHAQDSVTCGSCHDASAIMPTSDAGRQAHALLRQGVAPASIAIPISCIPRRRHALRRSERRPKDGATHGLLRMALLRRCRFAPSRLVVGCLMPRIVSSRRLAPRAGAGVSDSYRIIEVCVRERPEASNSLCVGSSQA